MRALPRWSGRLAPVFLLLLALVPPARASWSHDPAVNLPVCTLPATQDPTGIASDGAGGAYLAWHDFLNAQPRVQHVSALGVPLWGANGIALGPGVLTDTDPVCVPDGVGGVIVVWQDLRNGVDVDIFAQRLSAGGAPAWTAGGVGVCVAPGDQMRPRAIANGGGVIVAWQDLSSGNANLRAQSVDPGGWLLWGPGADVCSEPSDQDAIDLCSDGAGGTIVVWQDARAGTLDIYAQRLTSEGRVQWTVDGTPVCDAASFQAQPKVVSDGAGGAFVAWSDSRNGSYDIYAQRLSSAGAALWTANGRQLTTDIGNQMYPVMVTDGAGGVIVAWDDGRASLEDVYAQRLDASGAALWTAGGLAVTLDPAAQRQVGMVADGSGGAVIAWEDGRISAPGTDLFAQRLSSSGEALWTADGVPVSTAPGNQIYLLVAADDAGGAIISWTDGRHDVFAQRVTGTGFLGAPEPVFDHVRDVPNDQGGAVQVFWTGSAFDLAPGYGIGSYALWRQLDQAAAQAARARGERPAGVARSPGDVRMIGEGAEATWWEFIASIPARGSEKYAFTVATHADSTPGSVPWNRFVVDAREEPGPGFLSSPVDSGYSVDNLAPLMPSPFEGTYANGTSTLSWGASAAPDLAEFRLYRGATPGFVPGPGNLVTAQLETSCVDAAGAPWLYKLCAVDVHGNASPYAFLQPAGTTDVAGVLPDRIALSAPAPNPARAGCAMRLSLPREARVSLAIFDPLGRRVRGLIEGTRPAGEHAVAWDGRDAAGRPVPDGLYLVRLECEGRTIARRLVRIE